MGDVRQAGSSKRVCLWRRNPNSNPKTLGCREPFCCIVCTIWIFVGSLKMHWMLRWLDNIPMVDFVRYRASTSWNGGWAFSTRVPCVYNFYLQVTFKRICAVHRKHASTPRTFNKVTYIFFQED